MTAAAAPPPSERLLNRLFGLSAPVDRGFYLKVGLTLTALKYGLDTALIWFASAQVLPPLDYLNPALTPRSQLLQGDAEWALPLLIALSLPFLWVGLSMSLRRAVDAGVSPLLALLFLIPGFNYVTMLFLAMLPSAAPAEVARNAGLLHPRSRLVAALLGVAVGVSLALAMTLFSTLVLGTYGMMLFFVTPVMVGVFSGWIYNLDGDRGGWQTTVVSLLAVTLAGLSMLLVALEGAICVMMTIPLAAPMAVIGGVFGRELARRRGNALLSALLVIAALPVLTAVEAAVPTPLPMREVRTSVVIDAPPAVVWPNVVGFAELDLPPTWLYAAGVATPLRARIVGEGVGAVRHCEFTTGAFVEPITVWEPPTRLGFDVASQPPPMHEWSPYRHVHPPHLDGYLQSRRGEFRLIDLGDGRTRLEGSTWYTLDLAPVGYWALWSDGLIHGIHDRVLEHVKALSEAGHVSVPAALDDAR
jgi:hypothetical protein